MTAPKATPVADLPKQLVYVVFSPYTTANHLPFWLPWITSPGFRHVSALIPAELGTVILDPLGGGIFSTWTPFGGESCALAMANQGFTVLAVETSPQKTYANYGWWLHCVTVLKSLLGIRRFWLLTPEQLYRHLKREGAKEIKWLSRSRG